jgi:hypothetical protein
MKIVYLNYHGTKLQYHTKSKMENSIVSTYKWENLNDYTFKNWNALPGLFLLYYRKGQRKPSTMSTFSPKKMN